MFIPNAIFGIIFAGFCFHFAFVISICRQMPSPLPAYAMAKPFHSFSLAFTLFLAVTVSISLSLYVWWSDAKPFFQSKKPHKTRIWVLSQSRWLLLFSYQHRMTHARSLVFFLFSSAICPVISTQTQTQRQIGIDEKRIAIIFSYIRVHRIITTRVANKIIHNRQRGTQHQQ